MTEKESIRGYNKPRFEHLIKVHEARLREIGFSENQVFTEIKYVKHCIKVLGADDIDPDEINERMIDVLRERMTGIQTETCTRYLRSFGRFTQTVIGRNIYADGRRYAYEDYDGYIRRHFKMDKTITRHIENYVGSLKDLNVSDDFLVNEAKYVKHCCSVLLAQCGEFDPFTADGSTVLLLKSLMYNVSQNTCHRYLLSFGRFIAFLTGVNPYSEVTRPKRISDPGGHLRDLIKGLDYEDDLSRYLAHLEEMGFKVHSIRGIITSCKVCVQKLQEFGIDDLKDVDLRVFRRMKMEMDDLKESTLRVYMRNFGKFIEFVTGVNPYNDSMMLWNRGIVDREFIFQEDWRTLQDSTDILGRLVLALGGGMGLRRSEIAGIKLSDIHGRKLTIRGKGHGTKGLEATMDIPDGVMNAIVSYMPIRQKILELYGDHSEGHLLVRYKVRAGEPLGADSVGDLITHLAKRAGVECTTHSLRRLYATTLYDAETDLNTLRIMMRHADISTTLKCYINPDPRRIDGATKTIESALFG